jgi:wobble nucleotide-excising tRNase
MLTSIRLAGVATYDAQGAEMAPLQKCNLVYGPNGAGKTTLSKFIADPAGQFGTSSLVWKDNTSLKVCVYNRDFVENNLHASSTLKGIFTLGEEGAQLEEAIKAAGDRLRQAEKRALESRTQRDDQQKRLDKVETRFSEACWEQKVSYDAEFKDAMTGARGSMVSFTARVKEERLKNKATLATLEDLVTRARSVYVTTPVTAAELTGVSAAPFVQAEASPLPGAPVVGRTDVDIAGLIETLNNSDWVSTGRPYLGQSKPLCPFCQQKVPETLEASLNAFFDDSFEKSLTSIRGLCEGYKEAVARVRAAIEPILLAESPHFDGEALRPDSELFDTTASLAIQGLERKVREPSVAIDLPGVQDILGRVAKFIEEANARIRAHNTRVANLGTEKKVLSEQVWQHILSVGLKEAGKTYDDGASGYNKAIAALNGKLAEADKEAQEARQALEVLERKTTTTKPTVEAINKTLRQFSFSGFSLQEAEEANSYKLVRSDGTDARQSLSEGERTFVTFLYFYHLVRGSDSEAGLSARRVVVIDDPVSSLDNDILFIVSTLVKSLAAIARQDYGLIAQLFLLTHNIFFHKEVAYCGPGKSLAATTFWVVRKRNGVSSIKHYGNVNPIKTSYEILWQDVKAPHDAGQGIQNTLRRIIENYFKLLGGIDNDKLIAHFEGDDQLACRALVSWAHDGSHSVQDDAFMALDDGAIEMYLRVFHLIFFNEKQEGHYRHMMGDKYVPLPEPETGPA